MLKRYCSNSLEFLKNFHNWGLIFIFPEGEIILVIGQGTLMNGELGLNQAICVLCKRDIGKNYVKSPKVLKIKKRISFCSQNIENCSFTGEQAVKSSPINSLFVGNLGIVQKLHFTYQTWFWSINFGAVEMRGLHFESNKPYIGVWTLLVFLLYNVSFLHKFWKYVYGLPEHAKVCTEEWKLRQDQALRLNF